MFTIVFLLTGILSGYLALIFEDSVVRLSKQKTTVKCF